MSEEANKVTLNLDYMKGEGVKQLHRLMMLSGDHIQHDREIKAIEDYLKKAHKHLVTSLGMRLGYARYPEDISELKKQGCAVVFNEIDLDEHIGLNYALMAIRLGDIFVICRTSDLSDVTTIEAIRYRGVEVEIIGS